MSLDASLTTETKITKKGTGVFIRDNGGNVELTREQVLERWPNAGDVEEFEYESNEAFHVNITHNLKDMAAHAGLYDALWHPERLNITYAHELLPYLTEGFLKLISDPARFEKLNPDNGWGSYDGFVEAVRQYLVACVQFPYAVVAVSV